MEWYKDGTIIFAVVNLISAVVNVYWTVRLKSIQANREIMESMREENKDLKDLVGQLQKSKNQYKIQYNNILYKFQHLQGELKTYQRLHNHPHE